VKSIFDVASVVPVGGDQARNQTRTMQSLVHVSWWRKIKSENSLWILFMWSVSVWQSGPFILKFHLVKA